MDGLIIVSVKSNPGRMLHSASELALRRSLHSWEVLAGTILQRCKMATGIKQAHECPLIELQQTSDIKLMGAHTAAVNRDLS